MKLDFFEQNYLLGTRNNPEEFHSENYLQESECDSFCVKIDKKMMGMYIRAKMIRKT